METAAAEIIDVSFLDNHANTSNVKVDNTRDDNFNSDDSASSLSEETITALSESLENLQAELP